MPVLKQNFKQLIVKGPLHRPALELAALKQRIQYMLVGLKIYATRRQPKVFCIGNFKTGTVSMTGLLAQQLKGTHEPHAYLFSKMWVQYKSRQLSLSEWKDFLIRRSNALALDFEASGFLTTEAALLTELFPQSKFILTIREPESWIRSILKHILKNREKLGYHYWEPAFQYYFGEHDFPAEEAPLEAQDLYPIRALLEYWKTSNDAVIQSIPKERLLILDTKKLSESLEQLEGFMNLEPATLNKQKAHLHQSNSAQNPLSEVDQHYLTELTADYQQTYLKWTSRTESLSNQ